MDTNKMRDISRDQFESFARDVLDWSDDEFRLASDGKSYYWGSTGEAWVFWQASREAVVIQAPDMKHKRYWEQFEDVEGESFIYGRYIGHFIAAIEAQGLKVAP